MKIVVLKSPRCLAGLLRLVFGIRSRAVTRKVLSAKVSLTSVFGNSY